MGVMGFMSYSKSEDQQFVVFSTKGTRKETLLHFLHWRLVVQALVSCYLIRQETLLHFVSSPRCINGYQLHTVGGSPAMDWRPIYGGVAILLGVLC